MRTRGVRFCIFCNHVYVNLIFFLLSCFGSSPCAVLKGGGSAAGKIAAYNPLLGPLAITYLMREFTENSLFLYLLH